MKRSRLRGIGLVATAVALVASSWACNLEGGRKSGTYWQVEGYSKFSDCVSDARNNRFEFKNAVQVCGEFTSR